MKLRRLVPLSALLAAGVLASACQKKTEATSDQASPQTPAASATPANKAPDKTAAVKPAEPVRPPVEQIKPSIDIKTPPADATKLASGMIFKKLTSSEGPSPSKNDTVVIHFTAWKTSTGETFNTTRTRGTPMPLDLATAGPGFAEVFTQVHKGEKVMLWMPPELSSKNNQKDQETLAFEAELIEIQAAPAVPPDVAAPPATAKTTRGGLKYVVVTPGTGTERARFFDTAAFRTSIWDSTGKLLHSTEKRSRPMSSALYRQPKPLEDILTTMVVGQRTRFWVDAAKMDNAVAGAQGLLCYELQLIEITKGKAPPPTPKDVKALPAGVKKTASGVGYRVLKPGKGTVHPASSDTVRVHYTGWTTDGRMFDSSVTRGEPTSFPLTGVIKGWTDGIPTMVVGESTRFWIPEDLAYKGAPNNPKGMLVFDVELIEILPPAPASPHGGAPDDHGGHMDHSGHGH
jgi:FKBP-type peptidyl-prolyl cis-trans isomerase